MTRDWHATYLTDPTVADAARARVATTGEDGWAAAATLARSLPPGFGSHEAAGARVVLAPSSEPSATEEMRLERASIGGYYMEDFRSPGTVDEARMGVRNDRLPLPEITPPDMWEVLFRRSRYLPQRDDNLLFIQSHELLLRAHDFATSRQSRSLTDAPRTVVIHDEATGETQWVDGRPPPEQTQPAPGSTLRHLLDRIRSGDIDDEDARAHPAIGEARRRRLVTGSFPARWGERWRQGRIQLTELGKITLRDLVQRDVP